MALDRQQIDELLKKNKPDIVETAAAIDELFLEAAILGIKKITSGPDYWSWAEYGPGSGDRTYTLAKSANVEGFPLLTIRQTISEALDSSLVTSCVMIGLTRLEIRTRLTIIIANHTGAFAGLQSVMEAINSRDGDPNAGLVRSLEISQLQPLSEGSPSKWDIALEYDNENVKSDKETN